MPERRKLPPRRGTRRAAHDSAEMKEKERRAQSKSSHIPDPEDDNTRSDDPIERENENEVTLNGKPDVEDEDEDEDDDDMPQEVSLATSAAKARETNTGTKRMVQMMNRQGKLKRRSMVAGRQKQSEKMLDISLLQKAQEESEKLKETERKTRMEKKGNRRAIKNRGTRTTFPESVEEAQKGNFTVRVASTDRTRIERSFKTEPDAIAALQSRLYGRVNRIPQRSRVGKKRKKSMTDPSSRRFRRTSGKM
mmetsp:Transcript_16371/g.27026  ORF Transcript_16371/g.27026 Transcript_16371/m.27026 type:complete len:250 (-) Transcript_16371:75-824(-)